MLPPAGRPGRLDAFDVVSARAPRFEEAPTYESFYDLDEKPFSLSSDPKFLYHSVAHDRVAQELLSAIRRRDALVVITGERGLGKTMLCRAVMDQLDRRTLTSFVADPSVSIEELLTTILIDFGVIARSDPAGSDALTRASRQDLCAALREFLDSLASLQAFAVVLIDEAQDVEIGSLDEILKLSDPGGAAEQRLLQIVLVGQPALLRILRRAGVRGLAQGALVRCELEPLSADEIVSYVLHRLAVGGAQSRVTFDDGAFVSLDELSGGVPRLINLLCDHALKLGLEASSDEINAAMIERAADDLNIDRPLSRVRRVAHALVTVAALLLLMLVGAGAATLVFRERLSQIFVSWQEVPAPPRRPLLEQPLPIPPQPPPAADGIDGRRPPG